MSTALTTTSEDKPMTFVPYGSSDAIKLSVSIIQNVVAVPTKSGKTCSKRDALRFMMMCQARRLNPFEGDAFLVGYDGKNGPEFSLITSHQAFLKRAEIHPEFDGMTSGIIVLEDEETGKIADIEGDFHLRGQVVVGGWATVHFKNRKHPITRRIRMERFNKGFAQWQVDPAGMIVKCAEADALRSSFPTMLGGLYMQDEVMLDVKAKTVDVSEVSRLVETVSAPVQQPQTDDKEEAAAGLAPEPAPQKADSSPQMSLADVIAKTAHSFTTFQAWAIETGALPNADSFATYDEIPTKDAERLIRVFRGSTMKAALEQLAAIKAGGVV